MTGRELLAWLQQLDDRHLGAPVVLEGEWDESAGTPEVRVMRHGNDAQRVVIYVPAASPEIDPYDWREVKR